MSQNKRNNYLIVDKRILPDYYEKVLAAQEMLRTGAVKEVSEAARQAGISRSTYYKYKDYLYARIEERLLSQTPLCCHTHSWFPEIPG